MGCLHAEDTSKIITLETLGVTLDSRDAYIQKTNEALKAALTIQAFGNIDNYNDNIPDDKLEIFLNQIASYCNEAESFCNLYRNFESDTMIRFFLIKIDFSVQRIINRIEHQYIQNRDVIVNELVVKNINNISWEAENGTEQLVNEIVTQKRIIDDYIEEFGYIRSNLQKLVDEQLQAMSDDPKDL